MAAQPPRGQEQSIKERKRLLYEDDAPPPDATAPTVARKPFAEYLRTTPAAPLSPGVRAILWAAGVVVLLLLAASLLTGGR